MSKKIAGNLKKLIIMVLVNYIKHSAVYVNLTVHRWPPFNTKLAIWWYICSWENTQIKYLDTSTLIETILVNHSVTRLNNQPFESFINGIDLLFEQEY